MTCTFARGDADADRDVACGVECEPDEDEPSHRIVIKMGDTENMGYKINRKINDVISNAWDSAKNASQLSKDISAMVNKFFEERYK